jgi:hypothetical protein
VRVTGDKYACSTIWQAELSPDDHRHAELSEAAGTSDSIERYFGLASWLRAQSPNQTPVNRDFVLAMKETRLPTRLADALFTNKEQTMRKMDRMAAYVPSYMADQAKRQKLYGQAKVRIYLDALGRRAAAIRRAEERRAALDGIAAAHGHVRWLTFAAFRRTVVDPERHRTMKQQHDAVRSQLKLLLNMFATVYQLDEEADLHDVFYNEAGRRAIFSEGGTNFSNANLFDKMQRCSAYLEVSKEQVGPARQPVRRRWWRLSCILELRSLTGTLKELG